MRRHEEEAARRGYRIIAGVDEAGRGPLAGPVVAAAVVLKAGAEYPGLTDSKKMTPAARDRWFDTIRSTCVDYGIGIVDESIIDDINILRASLQAMRHAVRKLKTAPDFLLVDGNQRIPLETDQETIVGGDTLSLPIAAASVLAKVTRDRIMDEYDRQFPRYDFSRHKGYGTQLHRDRIREFGPCPIHRKSFKGVKEFVEHNE